jgi:hypothetical protein
MSHNRPLASLLVATAASLCCASAALADCSGFKWPLDTELAWLAAGGDVALKSGGELDALPAKAITLALKPSNTVTMPVTAGVKQQAIGADTFSGWFTIPAGVKPGLYQVSISARAWIDVVQGGALVPSKGFSGRQECQAISKSVRFDLGPGPVTVQISGAPADSVRVTLNAAK